MCAALLAFSSLLQGCGKTETASKNSTKEVLSESSEQQSTEPDKITFAFFCNLFIPEDMDMIEEALNEQTRKKINVAVEEAQANRTDIFEYAEKSTVSEDYKAFIEEFLKGVYA